jgi:hypothetical protein
MGVKGRAAIWTLPGALRGATSAVQISLLQRATTTRQINFLGIVTGVKAMLKVGEPVRAIAAGFLVFRGTVKSKNKPPRTPRAKEMQENVGTADERRSTPIRMICVHPHLSAVPSS